MNLLVCCEPIACSSIRIDLFGVPIGRRIRTKRPGERIRGLGLLMIPRTRSVPVLESTLLSLKLIVPRCGNEEIPSSSFSSERPTRTGTSASWRDLIFPSAISRRSFRRVRSSMSK